MTFKVDDKVTVRDYSYSIGSKNGKRMSLFAIYGGNSPTLRVIATNCDMQAKRDWGPEEVDLMVTDGEGGVWLTSSRCCEKQDEISINITYTVNGVERPLSELSDETLLKAKNR